MSGQAGPKQLHPGLGPRGGPIDIHFLSSATTLSAAEAGGYPAWEDVGSMPREMVEVQSGVGLDTSWRLPGQGPWVLLVIAEEEWENIRHSQDLHSLDRPVIVVRGMTFAVWWPQLRLCSTHFHVLGRPCEGSYQLAVTVNVDGIQPNCETATSWAIWRWLS